MSHSKTAEMDLWGLVWTSPLLTRVNAPASGPIFILPTPYSYVRSTVAAATTGCCYPPVSH